jgi:hypothetical protein
MSMIPLAALVFLTYLAGFFHGRISLRNERLRELEERVENLRKALKL